MFVVSCGTDLYGRKQNVKLEFASCPTMTQLINAVESEFDVNGRSTRPAGYPDVPFKVQTFQVYDDVLLRWVDLYSSSQLTNGSQIFCFQPESIWHSDSQGIIPEAKDTVTWTTPVGSPRRARIATDAGVAPALSEKLRSVFYDIDVGNKGYILYSDLRSAFAKAEIEFTYATAGEMFTLADSNRSGHVTYDEWVRFAIKYPSIVDALFFRSRDVGGQGGQGYGGYQVATAPTSVQRARESELRGYYTDTWQGAGQKDRLMSDYETARHAADSARMQKESAESRERQAWDKLYYNPSSPGHY
ncbi:calmodulin-like protein containing EF hand domain [Diplonema papillatum]|nr:calmodulin-like protein containing EF hand domain [Diplonema papillatum]